MPFYKLVAVIYIKRITFDKWCQAPQMTKCAVNAMCCCYSVNPEEEKKIVVKIGKIVVFNKQLNVFFDLCHQVTDFDIALQMDKCRLMSQPPSLPFAPKTQ